MKRWFYYAGIGLTFGIFDWFYLQWLSNSLGPSLGENPLIIIPVIITINYGILLLPIIPVVIYETRVAETIKTPILAGILTWCCALVGYYTYYTILLSFRKLPNLEHLNIFDHLYQGFWQEYQRMFVRVILMQILAWLPIAIIGGGLLGVFFWWIRSLRHQNNDL